MFKYKIKRPPSMPVPLGKPIDNSPREVLSGYVYGMKASDIEERFARALSKNRRIDKFEFRVPVIQGRGLSGFLEVDFIVVAQGRMHPLQIDGEYSHKNTSKKMDDLQRDILVNEFLRRYNAMPVKRINGRELDDQDMANLAVKELFG